MLNENQNRNYLVLASRECSLFFMDTELLACLHIITMAMVRKIRFSWKRQMSVDPRSRFTQRTHHYNHNDWTHETVNEVVLSLKPAVSICPISLRVDCGRDENYKEGKTVCKEVIPADSRFLCFKNFNQHHVQLKS